MTEPTPNTPQEQGAAGAWERVGRAARGLSFRLNLWHTLIFTASALALFAVFYWLLSFAIERKDREVVQAGLAEFAAVYNSRGAPGLRAHLAPLVNAPGRQTLFVRVTSPAGTTPVLIVPQEWVTMDVRELAPGIRLETPYVRRPANDNRDLTIGQQGLADGAALLVGRITDSREQLLAAVRKLFLTVMAPIVVLGFMGGAAFTRRAMQPIRRIIAAMREIIRTGDLSQRVPEPKTRDELAELAELFNRMIARNERLIQAMRDSLDNVAHDLRTPLARLRGAAELALRNSGEEQSREALADTIEETDRVLTMLNTLLDVAEAETGLMRLKLEEVDLPRLLDETAELYQCVAEEKQIRVARDYAADGRLVVRADRSRLRQVFANLLDNALKYTPAGGEVRIHAHATERPSSEGVLVEIADTGPGIPIEEQPRVWERLYRGDKSRSQRGLGLGLSLVKAIIEAHHGRITLESALGRGAVFRVELKR